MGRCHLTTLTITVIGTTDSIVEIGEQIAWFGASLRSSPFVSGVCVCHPFIRDLRLDSADPSTRRRASCNIDFSMERADGKTTANGQCWHGLFLNPVVVGGYPIPRRSEGDTGLEIPLSMMTRLAGAKRVTFFNDNLVVKGYSTLLVPMKRREDLIMWHLIYDKQGKRISYLSDIVSWSMDVGYSDLENCRHILGWCSQARYFAGEYQSNISYELLLTFTTE
jgi:hypothetical protein